MVESPHQLSNRQYSMDGSKGSHKDIKRPVTIVSIQCGVLEGQYECNHRGKREPNKVISTLKPIGKKMLPFVRI